MYVFDVMTDVRFVEGFARIFDLRLLMRDPGRSLINSSPTTPVPHIRIEGNRIRFVLLAMMWLLGNRNSYDAIVVLDNVTAALAANLSRLVTRKPVILTLGKPTLEYFRCKRSMLGTITYWMGYLALVVLTKFNEPVASVNGCVSRATAALTKGNKTVIPAYGVDTEIFSPRGTRQEAREALDLPLDKPIILCRSRVAPEKDPETFLAAVSKLLKGGTDLVVLYVGGEFPEFVSLADDFQVPVLAVGHVHPQVELPLYYRAADLTIQTSKEEGLGMSPLEALACGTPVIASAVGGLVESIRPGETGWLVPAGDSEALAEAIMEVLNDPDEASRRASRGRRMVEEEYSVKLAFEAWKRLADSVIEKDP